MSRGGIKISVTTNTREWLALRKRIAKLASRQVSVGTDGGTHAGSGISYDELMAIAELGAPRAGTPARHLVTLAIKHVDVRAALERASKEVIDGADADKALAPVAVLVQSKVRAEFGANELEPTKAHAHPAELATGELRDHAIAVVTKK